MWTSMRGMNPSFRQEEEQENEGKCKLSTTTTSLSKRKGKTRQAFLAIVVFFVSTRVVAVCCAFEVVVPSSSTSKIIRRRSSSSSSFSSTTSSLLPLYKTKCLSSTARSKTTSLHAITKTTTTTTTTTKKEIQKDIEYATHSSSDKLLHTSDIIAGSINITSIEDGLPPPQTNGYPKKKNGVKKKEEEKKGRFTIRQLWKKRYAKRIEEEGIRRRHEEEETVGGGVSTPLSSSSSKLSSLLRSITHSEPMPPFSISSSPSSSEEEGKIKEKEEITSKRKYGARTIAGLIVALAEEADGLDVEVDARRDTPLWGKHVDAVTINFTRLGFKPLRMGGLDQAIRELETSLPPSTKETIAYSLGPTSSDYTTNNNKRGIRKRRRAPTADEAFDRIDVDNSGALDQEELTTALSLAAGIETSDENNNKQSSSSSSPSSLQTKKAKTKELLSNLAKRLINLYDANGDGVVDRQEYQSMVEDMAALRRAQRERTKLRRMKMMKKRRKGMSGGGGGGGWRKTIRKALKKGLKRIRRRRRGGGGKQKDLNEEESRAVVSSSDAIVNGYDKIISSSSLKLDDDEEETIHIENEEEDDIYDLSNDPSLLQSFTGRKRGGSGEGGSIVLSDLKLDLRRLLFGAVPFVKKITPGGPLILEPFTMTATASFTREDIMDSNLLDAGLRRLVARALSRRVRSLRDLVDGAVFYGRTWNMASREAPYVEVPKLENVEFDKDGRLIITGRARVRAKPGAPFVDNAFKLRTRIGTREGGQVIRLQDPEIALVLECPKAWERNIVSACQRLNLPIPTRPKPIYSYIPLVSPLKKNDKDGYNLGDDNKIKSIEVKNGALCFEVSAVLRPGRFLGNHYLAFTVPNRTFIITLDRIREGMRVARKNKQAAKEAIRAAEAQAQRGANEKYNAIMAQSLATDKVVLDSREDLKFVDPDGEGDGAIQQEKGVEDDTDKKGFFGRFVEGYSSFEDTDDEEVNDRMFAAISDWFGRQDSQSDDEDEEYDDHDDDEVQDDTLPDDR